MLYAYQGVPGAYSQLACLQYQSNCQTQGYEHFIDMLNAVISGEADFGMLPIFNITAGPVMMALQALNEVSNLHLKDCTKLLVEHCLLALPGTKLETLRTVHSHPQVLFQCINTLEQMKLEPVEAYDTAGAAKLLAEEWQDPSKAVLASKYAAELYGLEILKTPMNDQLDNTTHFVIVEKVRQ